MMFHSLVPNFQNLCMLKMSFWSSFWWQSQLSIILSQLQPCTRLPGLLLSWCFIHLCPIYKIFACWRCVILVHFLVTVTTVNRVQDFNHAQHYLDYYGHDASYTCAQFTESVHVEDVILVHFLVTVNCQYNHAQTLPTVHWWYLCPIHLHDSYTTSVQGFVLLKTHSIHANVKYYDTCSWSEEYVRLKQFSVPVLECPLLSLYLPLLLSFM